ncbi:MAG: HD domain-containing protein [Desulforegulaceae bacterium]|nr:HD domain-containing protein [Desulforegulaceae bacterium]
MKNKIIGFFKSLRNKPQGRQIILLEELSFLWLDDDSVIGKEEKENFFAELAEVEFKNKKIKIFWKELYDSQIFSFELNDLVFIISKALFFLEKNFDKKRINPQTPLPVQNPVSLGEHSLNVARTIFQKNKGLSPRKILCMVTAALCHDLGYALDGYVRHETGSLSWLESLLADKNIGPDIFHITEAIQNHHEKPSLKSSKISKALFVANQEENEKELSKINASLPTTPTETQIQTKADPPEDQENCQNGRKEVPPPGETRSQHSANETALNHEKENEQGGEDGNDSKEIFLWERNIFIHPRAWDDCQRSPLFSSLKNIEKYTCVFKFEKKKPSLTHKTQSRGIYYILNDENDSLKIASALALKEGIEDDFLKLMKVEIKRKGDEL